MLLTNKEDKIIACFVKFLTAYVYKTPSLLLFPAYDGVISLPTAIPLETIEKIVFVHIFRLRFKQDKFTQFQFTKRLLFCLHEISTHTHTTGRN